MRVTTAAVDPAVRAPISFDDGAVVGLAWDDRGRLVSDRPWPAQRGPVQAFFHGRLSNRAALCDELGLRSRDVTDDDVVLEVFVRWRDAGLERLRGVFVAGVLDVDTHEALVARDQVGCHPLFYARPDGGQRILFGISTLDLLGQPGVDRTLNRPALADHLCRRWPDREETFFEGIRRVPPGCRVRVSRMAIGAERYWDPVPEDQEIEWIQGDVAEQFDAVFNQAVDRCLSFGPSGVFLSGGFDSISVAAVAVDRASSTNLPPPHALSLEFPHPGCNERPTQTAIAEALGIRQDFLHFDDAIGGDSLLGAALKLNSRLGAPVLNAWYPAYLTLARLGQSKGVKTIMTGNGGDEWLGVSPLLSADLIRRGDLAGLLRFMRTWQRSYSPDRLPLVKSALWTYGLRPISSMMLHRMAPEAWHRNRLGRAMRRDPAWVAPDPSLRDEQKRRLPGDFVSPDPPLGFYLQDGRSAIDHTLVSWELEEQYDMGRQAGVGFQHPYWDADLIDMLYRTPPDSLNAGGRSKGLVRHSMARRFPKLGLERRRKVGAATFYKSLLSSQGPGINAAGYPALTSLGVIDEAMARDGLTKIFAEKHELYRAWELANLETWVAQFLENGRIEGKDGES